MTILLPEITDEGLSLWRLSRPPDDQLWCSVSRFGGELALTVNNLGTGQVPVAESHSDVGAIIRRADELREQFVAAGWTEIDVDLDEPD